MKVKKYRAPDRSTALKQIRDELGPQAMIVQEQRVRAGFFGLFGTPQVEVLAAIEDEHLDGPPTGGTSGTSSIAERAVANSQTPGAEMAISSAARHAAASAAAAAPSAESRLTDRARPPQPGGLSDEGTSKLAAILETFPKNGQPIPAAMASSLADLISRAAAGEEVSPPSAALSAAKGVSASRVVGVAPDSPSTNGISLARGPDAPVPSARPANGTAQHAGAASQPGSLSSPSSQEVGSVQQTLAEIQTAVLRLTQQQQDAQMPREAPAVRVAYQQLIQQEIEPGLALDLAGLLSDEVGMDIYVDQPHVNTRAAALLGERLSVGAVRLPPHSDHLTRTTPPTVVVLVGPTGVGKTTTLAKLASYYAFTLGKKVALVTTDTFRIAAAAQLGTYAEILELPLEVVYRAEEIPNAIGRHLDADIILIDTPGCGQQDQVKIHELAAFVDSSLTAVPDTVVLLTLSAPTKLRDLLHVRRGFGELPIHGFIFTKLDETTAYGPLISLAVRAAKPVYFVTTGQRVPNDIETAARERLVDLLFHGLTPPAAPATPVTPPVLAASAAQAAETPVAALPLATVPERAGPQLAGATSPHRAGA
jgi:flagellar biosynthesis protein FlhF